MYKRQRLVTAGEPGAPIRLFAASVLDVALAEVEMVLVVLGVVEAVGVGLAAGLVGVCEDAVEGREVAGFLSVAGVMEDLLSAGVVDCLAVVAVLEPSVPDIEVRFAVPEIPLFRDSSPELATALARSSAELPMDMRDARVVLAAPPRVVEPGVFLAAVLAAGLIGGLLRVLPEVDLPVVAADDFVVRVATPPGRFGPPAIKERFWPVEDAWLRSGDVTGSSFPDGVSLVGDPIDSATDC